MGVPVMDSREEEEGDRDLGSQVVMEEGLGAQNPGFWEKRGQGLGFLCL